MTDYLIEFKDEMILAQEASKGEEALSRLLLAYGKETAARTGKEEGTC